MISSKQNKTLAPRPDCRSGSVSPAIQVYSNRANVGAVVNISSDGLNSLTHSLTHGVLAFHTCFGEVSAETHMISGQ